MGTWVVRVAAIVALGVGGVAVYVAAHPALPSSSGTTSAAGQPGGSGTSSAGHHRSSRQRSGALKPGITTNNLNPATGYGWMKVSTSWVGRTSGGETEIVTVGSSAKTPARGAVVVRIANHAGRTVKTRVLHRAKTGTLTITRQAGSGKLELRSKSGQTYELTVSTARLVRQR